MADCRGSWMRSRSRTAIRTRATTVSTAISLTTHGTGLRWSSTPTMVRQRFTCLIRRIRSSQPIAHRRIRLQVLATTARSSTEHLRMDVGSYPAPALEQSTPESTNCSFSVVLGRKMWPPPWQAGGPPITQRASCCLHRTSEHHPTAAYPHFPVPKIAALPRVHSPKHPMYSQSRAAA